MSGSDVNKANGETGPSSQQKRDRVFLVELKNGKVNFKQKITSFEKQSETLQEIVKFREMLEQRIEKDEPPLSAIPEDHKPLIAKLAHESDKSLPALSKYIRQELLPVQDEDAHPDDTAKSSRITAALPLKVVETSIKSILSRNNYGLEAQNGGKTPAAVCIWRWEVKAEHREWLPKNGREKAEIRQAERIQAKQDLKTLFDALSEEEKDRIFDPKANSKTSTAVGQPEQASAIDLPKTPTHNMSDKHTEEVDSQPGSIGKPNPPKKSQDPEKLVKEKERIEKKAAKADKEKKLKDAQEKSRSIMTSFFAKSKALKENDSSAAGPSTIRTEFEKTFKPFVLKKGSTLAPINWFLSNKQQGKLQDDVIIIDIAEDSPTTTGDVEMQDPVLLDDLSSMTAQARLQSILSRMPVSADSSSGNRKNPTSLRYKTYHPIGVREIMTQVSEAEITGDTSLVRSHLSKLRDRSVFPAKALIFDDDRRPGYFGTWTRNSLVIGPRTPFKKDMINIDYSYDSGEEWEEEPVGDADDVAEDGEDEDGEDEGRDSDLDSWLVDDDEVVEIPPEERDLSPPLLDIPAFRPTKRKADDGEKKLGKKRKVVIPLVPFTKGPCWETRIGEVDYDPFKTYRIQFFNDTPFPIDPFKFVSTCIEDKKASANAKKAANAKANDAIFAVPPLPDRLANPGGDGAESTLLGSATAAPKRAAAAQKAQFPPTHLPFLLDKISELQTPSIILLVEAIYQELRVHKVKKKAIEAKVREVGEKCKEKKFWIVKPSVKSCLTV